MREEVLKHCSVGILDSSVEDVLWVQFSWGKEEQALVLAVCYIPPESLQVAEKGPKRHCRHWRRVLQIWSHWALSDLW